MTNRRLRKKGVKGSQSEGLIPIDVAILGHLPAEGTMLAEFIPLGTTAGAVKKRLDNVITSNQVGGRLMAMSFLEYVVNVPMMPVSRGLGWQRTQKADELLERAKETDPFKAVEEANDVYFQQFDDGTPPPKRGRPPKVQEETDEEISQTEPWYAGEVQLAEEVLNDE
jgi:hypothetical protein